MILSRRYSFIPKRWAELAMQKVWLAGG